MESVSQTHHDSADDLTLDAYRIQRCTDIVCRGDLYDLDYAGLLVNLHLDRLGRIFPSGHIFFSLRLMREGRIVTFASIPPSAQNRFLVVVGVLQNLTKCKRGLWLLVRYCGLILLYLVNCLILQ